MMNTLSEPTESTPNVKMVRDSGGSLWLCDASAGNDGDLAGQGCVRVEEIVYDRMFGG
jgi:hypothetical protein